MVVSLDLDINDYHTKEKFKFKNINVWSDIDEEIKTHVYINKIMKMQFPTDWDKISKIWINIETANIHVTLRRDTFGRNLPYETLELIFKPKLGGEEIW